MFIELVKSSLRVTHDWMPIRTVNSQEFCNAPPRVSQSRAWHLGGVEVNAAVTELRVPAGVEVDPQAVHREGLPADPCIASSPITKPLASQRGVNLHTIAACSIAESLHSNNVHIDGSADGINEDCVRTAGYGPQSQYEALLPITASHGPQLKVTWTPLNHSPGLWRAHG